jgi:hypothetical protein
VNRSGERWFFDTKTGATGEDADIAPVRNAV